ncbi:hypothetical protein BLA60_10410 [Actinophytocola xinjiangensis]|uniref:HTH luxR-type domain-containing protein n=1 Tax=Actinophytocola xinjiangensis TaxID=485602 RepID=A0A7Z1AYZ9_9PSEU|nr:LuxR family transcriptional regulator [Actinophytocola xinjiangensis]OLF12369.1 hypothetical protein BLA60_10410 [Actinophytocola xinjiangensis]
MGPSPDRDATLSAPRFVGRDGALAALRDALARPAALVDVAGETGIGKTRLVDEWLLAEPGRPRRVLVAACLPFREPYTLGPLVDAVRQGTVGVGGLVLTELAGALRPLFPEWTGDLPPAPEAVPDATAARHRMFRALLELVGALHVDTLIVEDVHWADDATLEFLLFLTSRAVRNPPGVVLTYRPEDVPAGSLLPRLLTSRSTAGPRLRLELSPLDVDDTAALVSSMFGDESVSEAFARFLHRHTEGVPLALEESVRLLRDRGDVIRDEGEWSRRSVEELRVPPMIRDAVLERVDRVGGPARLVLEAAAVLGEPAGDELLAEVSGVDDPAAVTEVIDTGLLAERERNRLGYRHMLASRAVYDAIPVTRRRQLHARAGDALRTGDPPPLTRLTRHFREAGAVAEWARYTGLAAERAVGSNDHTAAVTLLLDLVAAPALDPVARAGFAARLAVLAVWRTEAVDDLHRAVVAVLREVVAGEGADRRQRAEIHYGLGRLLVQQHDYEAGSAELERAAHGLAHDPATAVSVMTYLAWPLTTPWPAARHRYWLRRAVATLPRARAATGEDLELLALQASAWLFLGDERGWDIVARFPTTAPTLWTRQKVSRGWSNFGGAAIVWGRYGDAKAWLGLARRAAEAEYGRLLDTITGNAVELRWLTGEWDGLLAEVTALVASVDEENPVRWSALLVQGALLAVRGEPDRAAEHLARELDRALSGGQFVVAVQVSAALARVLAARDDHAGVLAVTDRPMRWFEAKGVWIWGADIVPVRVAALCGAGDVEGAAALSAAFAAGLGSLRAPAPRAAALTCRAMVVAARGDHARAAAEFGRAADAWDRLPRPYEAWLARQRRGSCVLAAGDRERGLALLSEAYQGLAAMGARADADRIALLLRGSGVDVPRPWRGGRRGYGDQLSPRELEVVRLVAAGHTNRQVADALSRSPRTVATQLNSAMRKLGVSSRTALAVAVARHEVRLPEPD